ncbi:fatty acid desaturase [Chromatiales bacterium (ex Bugula neritina AB1)]|nr:fatty acid desaturase [Chromatiales bacterium (ex Bugula neritina AB1)]
MEPQTKKHSTVPILTPLTQALQEGALSRRELKSLMRRSNGPALRRLAGFLAMTVFTGYLVWLAQNSVWLLPAMFIHGIVLVHHFSLQHECIHYTAFKTRKLNDIVGNYCGLVIMLPNRFFRYEHCDHHTYTQQTGSDPEMIPLPQSLWGYIYYLSSIPYWKAKLTELWQHSRGVMNATEKRFVPKTEIRTLILEARIMLAFYMSVLLICIVFNWWAPLWYWWLPVILGEPVMRAIRMTEHVGRPTLSDLKVNTRSNQVSPLMQFLCWNMNFHAAHHYASSVPFHALPRLQQKLKGYIHVEDNGYLGAHKDILSQLLGKKKRE